MSCWTAGQSGQSGRHRKAQRTIGSVLRRYRSLCAWFVGSATVAVGSATVAVGSAAVAVGST